MEVLNGPVHLVGLGKRVDVVRTVNSVELKVGLVVLQLAFVRGAFGAERKDTVEASHFGTLGADVLHAVLLVALSPGVLDGGLFIELRNVDVSLARIALLGSSSRVALLPTEGLGPCDAQKLGFFVVVH